MTPTETRLFTRALGLPDTDNGQPWTPEALAFEVARREEVRARLDIQHNVQCASTRYWKQRAMDAEAYTARLEASYKLAIARIEELSDDY